MLVFLTLRFFILIKPCVTGTDFPLWYYMPVAGDPCSNLIRRGGIIFSTTQAKKHHTKYKVQNFCMCGCKRQNTHFEFKAAGLHRPPSDSVRTFVVIITSVNKEPGVIILHVNGKDITSALRINSKVNRMNRVNLCINSPAL